MASTSAYPASVANGQVAAGVRPKYVFLCPWTVKRGSGVNNVVVGLRAALREEFEPEIVVTGWHRPMSGQHWLKLPPAEFGPRAFFGFLYRLIPNAIRLVRLSRGAVAINPHYFGSEILPLILLRKLRLVPKVVLSVHGADVAEIAQGGRIQRWIYSFICRNGDVVVACSGALGEQVRQLSPRANVVPVWNGVTPPPARFGPRPLQQPYLLSVAAFVKKKGHDVLIEAFRQIAAEFPDRKLVLIGGDGPERSAVEQQIEAAGLNDRVQLMVNVEHDRVWDWMHHAECFVHAARVEPFGIAVLEAALAGTPVVATAVGGIREYMTNEFDGFTVEPDDPAQFAARVRQMLLDPVRAAACARSFSQKAREFTWEAAWQRYRAAAGL